MQKAKKGILVNTDVATKIYLLRFKDRFLIRDIDETSMFIEESQLDFVRQ